MKKFSFMVLAYNHEDYIIEHLESIKYLVCEYGEGLSIDLIINDDNSRDKTRSLIDKWLKVNSILFEKIKCIYNKENQGTCRAVINLLAETKGTNFKITAGDDVYSCENIFSIMPLPSKSILFGSLVKLIDNKIYRSDLDNFHIISTQMIYKNRRYSDTMKFISYQNTPNTFYSFDILQNTNMKKALEKCDLIEDWSIGIECSKDDTIKRYWDSKVYLYYRRTSNSVFINEGKRFKSEKLKIFDRLISNEKQFIAKIVLISRKYDLKIKSKLSRLINIGLYIYLFQVIINIRTIIKEFRKNNIDTDKYQKHYNMIRLRALEFNK